MNLEIKHLVPYLPYKLNIGIYDFFDKDKLQIEEVKSIHNYFDKVYCNINLLPIDNFLWRPILRPMSDLRKEIEHNGKKVIPYDYLDYLYTFEKDNKYYIRMYIDQGWTTKIEELPYNLVSLLLEWHLDVFNLIPERLAIDINTLKTTP